MNASTRQARCHGQALNSQDVETCGARCRGAPLSHLGRPRGFRSLHPRGLAGLASKEKRGRVRRGSAAVQLAPRSELLFWRIRNTGTPVSRSTASATDPNKSLLNPVRPCVVMMIRSAPASRAPARISATGSPQRTSVVAAHRRREAGRRSARDRLGLGAELLGVLDDDGPHFNDARWWLRDDDTEHGHVQAERPSDLQRERNDALGHDRAIERNQRSLIHGSSRRPVRRRSRRPQAPLPAERRVRVSASRGEQPPPRCRARDVPARPGRESPSR